MSDKLDQATQDGASNRRKKPPAKRTGKRLEGLFTGIETLPSAPREEQPSSNDGIIPAIQPGIAPVVPPAVPEDAQKASIPSSSIREPRPGSLQPASRQPETRTPPATGPLTLNLPLGGAAAQRQAVEVLPPGSRPVSPLALESLQIGKALVQPSDTDRPATLAYGRRLGVGLTGQPDDSGSLTETIGAGEVAAPALLLEVLDDTPGRVWSEDELLLVEQVTDQLTLALENARLFEEARQRNEELATLNQVTGAVSTMRELDQALPEVLAQALAAIDYESGLISIANQPADATDESRSAPRLDLAVHAGLPDRMVSLLQAQGMQGTVCDLVFKSAQLVYLPDLTSFNGEALIDATQAEWATEAARSLLPMGFQAYIGVP